MTIKKSKGKHILSIAKRYLGTPYSPEFNCISFIRTVYAEAGISIPKMKPYAPPAYLNLSKKELENPPLGHILFLKDREDPRKERAWTHVVIIAKDNTCIHCSIFFGRKVVITPLEEMYKRYDLVESSID